MNLSIEQLEQAINIASYATPSNPSDLVFEHIYKFIEPSNSVNQRSSTEA